MPAIRTRTETLNSLYATNWAYRRQKLHDQVFYTNPVFVLLAQGKRVKTQVGGRIIEIRLRYAKNQTIRFIRKGGTVTLASSDIQTVAEYNWTYLTGHVVRYGADVQKNRGRTAISKMVNDDLDDLQASIQDYIEQAIFSDGTMDESAAFTGLDGLLPETTTSGSVGGINRASNTWWRPNSRSMSSKALSAYLVPYLRTDYNTCAQWAGNGMSRFPDLILTDQTTHEAYEDEAYSIGRIQIPNKQLMDLGLGSLMFKGAPVMWAPNCPSGNLWMLNTNFIDFTYDPGMWLEMGEWLQIPNQPMDQVSHSLSACCMTLSNSRKHYRWYNIGS